MAAYRVAGGNTSRLVTLITAAFLVSCAHTTQGQTPERTVHANKVLSTLDPSVELELPQSVTYVGADTWLLYDVADCEVHVFVDADDEHRVQRVYWIQFEKYIDSKPTYKYEYSDPITQLGGLDFFANANIRSGDSETPRSGSDFEHVLNLIENKGFLIPKESLNVRFVHLPDESKRSELMIIYMEDMASTGVSLDQLYRNDELSPRWTSIAQELVERAKEQISIHTLNQ